MKLINVFYLIMAVIVLNSCHVQKLAVEVYVPPKVEFPPPVRDILVSSRFVPATGEYDAVQWGYFEEVDSVMWDLSRYYAQSFSNALDSTERYRSKTDFKLRMLKHNRLDMPEPLPWQGLLKISDKSGAVSLAILQGFKVEESKLKVSKITSDSGDSFKAFQTVTIDASWRISQPERRRMLDENTYSFSKDFVGTGDSRELALKALPLKEEMYKLACDWAAAEYAQIITPGTELVQRDYYKDGDPKLVEAHEAILEGNWIKAKSKWDYLAYKAEEDEIKAKASYNMALFCEKDGRLNQALGYARKANKYMPHRRHLKLINELNTKMFLDEGRRKRKEVIRNW